MVAEHSKVNPVNIGGWIETHRPVMQSQRTHQDLQATRYVTSQNESNPQLTNLKHGSEMAMRTLQHNAEAAGRNLPNKVRSESRRINRSATQKKSA